MSKIQVMSTTLANMIAAGEVIERPSSVIKELVENSIDAKAKNILIIIENAGKNLISVKDDGEGMDHLDAQLAFKRHASSKVKSIYDLPRITTLGFRGEAIPSIASISHVKMETSNGVEGSEVISEPDSELQVKPSMLRKGTTFEIRELFFNTPARLKYLKSDKTEIASCIETVQHLALGFPEIRFSLIVDKKEVLKTTGRGNFLETIASIYGNEIAKNCLPFNLVGDGFKGDGYIVHPSFSYSNRYGILTFLNNRYVYMGKVQKAIIDAYKDYLPPNRYPLTFIRYEVDYSLVDVNVHPTKKEVRLSCEDSLSSGTNKACLIALSKTKNNFDEVKIPEVNVTLANKLEEKIISKQAYNEENITVNKSIENKEDNQPSLFDAFDNEEKDTYKEEITFKDSNSVFKGEEEVKPITAVSENFPKLIPVGQVLETYIVCDSLDGLYLIDQHAAAERINFEKCEAQFNKEPTLVTPLFPIVVDLTPALKVNYNQEHIDLLKKIGIFTSLFGPSSIKVDELPDVLQGEEEISDVREIINQALLDKQIDLKAIKRLAIATKACKMSIKANRVLSKEEMFSLISQLSKCHNPLNCPHGRPTVIKISKYDIEKLFKRTGF